MKAVAGLCVIVAASTLLGANAWLSGSVIEPLRDVEPFDLVFYFPPAWVFVACVLASFAALVAVQVLTTPSTGVWQTRFAVTQVAYLSPLTLFALPPLTVLAAMLGYHRWATPWLYLFVDLRWPFFLTVGVLLAATLDARVGGTLRSKAYRLASRLNGRRLSMGLVVLLTAFSWASSPRLRFQSIIVGDEPKYLRFLENWYRGGGLDISEFPPLQELRDDSPHLAANIAHFADAARVTLGALLTDVQRIAGGGMPSSDSESVEVTAAGNWSVRGVHGGVYQGHHPGASIFLLPGYVLDRYFLNWTNVHQQTLPTNLYATNASMFVIYLLWAIALYRMLAAYTGGQLVPFALTAVAMMSLPATAFSYQYYAEAAGGLVITLTAAYAIFSADERRFVAFGAGTLTGFLPLMHPRWGPAAVVVATTVLWSVRRRPAHVIRWFLAGFMLMMAGFVLYTFYITGSLLPWTMYEIDPTTPGFSMSRALRDLPKLWLHWRWGLIAHAPVYLLALPGLLLLGRRPAVAVPIVLIILLTAVLAASHGWGGSGTTPTRLIAAVVPLLLLPMSESALRFGRSRLFVACAVLLSIVSIENGFFYNRFFDRSDVAFNAPSISGWKTPLLLVRPEEGAHVDGVLVFWTIVCAAAVVLPLLITRRREPRVQAPSWVAMTAAVLILFATTGSAVNAYSGSVVGWKFQHDRDEVERRLVAAYLASPGRDIWMASRGRTPIADLVKNAVAPRVALHPTLSPDGHDVELSIEIHPGDTVRAWGRAAVDFGDGTRATEIALSENMAIRHRYSEPGEYAIALQWSRPGAAPAMASAAVRVEDSRVAIDVPEPLVRYPRSITVRAVLVGPHGVEIRCEMPEPIVRADVEWWVWLGTAQNDRRGGAVYQARSIDASGDARTLRFDVEPKPSAGEWVRLSVGGRGRSGNRARSAAVAVQWPPDRLTRGAPVGATVTSE